MSSEQPKKTKRSPSILVTDARQQTGKARGSNVGNKKKSGSNNGAHNIPQPLIGRDAAVAFAVEGLNQQAMASLYGPNSGETTDGGGSHRPGSPPPPPGPPPPQQQQPPLHPYRHHSGGGSATSLERISVDNLLSGVSDIPSGQSRLRHRGDSISSQRAGSIRSGLPYSLGRSVTDPFGSTIRKKASLNPANVLHKVTQGANPRTSKVSEKLVLLPENPEPSHDDFQTSFQDEWDYADEDMAPLRDDEQMRRQIAIEKGIPKRSYAERMPKARRQGKLPRVTAYYIADGFRLKEAMTFFRTYHHVSSLRMYDEALYVPYSLPLLRGSDGFRVRSNVEKRTLQGKTELDCEIEENEQNDHYDLIPISSPQPTQQQQQEQQQRQDSSLEDATASTNQSREDLVSESTDTKEPHGEEVTLPIQEGESSSNNNNNTSIPDSAKELELEEMTERAKHDLESYAELFVFSYGVFVFWNFTEHQEKDILADWTFGKSSIGLALSIRAIPEEDIETEEFNFEYSPKTKRPRIYNDMITLRSSDHMIKLAMSHALAQSTKLCRFEARMETTMQDVQLVPKSLALTGELGMNRQQVVKMTGRLFKLRVDVNLSSNVLDTPDFFWEAEPLLHPLYSAVREYLEIQHRIRVINDRCEMFLELTDLVSETIAELNMDLITWVIIALICLSLVASVSEIVIRYSILTK